MYFKLLQSLLVVSILILVVNATKPLGTSERDCVINDNCGCTSLWDSDCDCEDPSNVGKCDLYCRSICRELWTPKNISDYNLTSCDPPKFKNYIVKLFVSSRDFMIGKDIFLTKGYLEAMNDFVDFEVVFVAEEKILKDGRKVFVSKFGDQAIKENMYQLCAINIYRETRIYIPFMLCLNAKYNVTAQLPECSKQFGLDYDKIVTCADTHGPDLQSLSIQTAREYGIFTTSILTVDDRVYELDQNAKVDDTVKMMCHVFLHASVPFPWWVFGFLGGLIFSMFLVIFTIKTFSVPKFILWLTQNDNSIQI